MTLIAGDVFESSPKKSTADERWSGVESRRATGGAGRVTKVVVLGNTAVGKTSVIRRFAKGEFVDKYRATIGADFLSKAVSVSASSNLTLQIWDTAGQERFRALSSVFFRGADACILVCAVDNRESLVSGIPDWHAEFSAKCSTPTCLALVVTKTDVADWQFSKDDVAQIAESLKISAVHFVSSLSGEGVEDLFSFVASEVANSGGPPEASAGLALGTLQLSAAPDLQQGHPHSNSTSKLRDCLCRSC